MAADERWFRPEIPIPHRSDYVDVWFGDTLTYPTGRGQQATATGWECPGCRRCWAPGVLACHYCPQEQPAPAFIAKSGEITDDEYER